MAKKPPFPCNQCAAMVEWAEPYIQGKRPLDAGTTNEHQCKDGVPVPSPLTQQTLETPTQTTAPQQARPATQDEPVKVPAPTITDRAEDSRLMLRTGIDMCKKFALEIYPISEATEEFHNNTQRVILFEVMLKSFCYNWVRF